MESYSDDLPNLAALTDSLDRVVKNRTDETERQLRSDIEQLYKVFDTINDNIAMVDMNMDILQQRFQKSMLKLILLSTFTSISVIAIAIKVWIS